MASEEVEYLTIEEVCETIYRYPSFYGMEKFTSGVPVIRGEHLLPSGAISEDWSDYWFVAPEYSAKHPKTILKLHDVVMSVRGSVGTFARVGDAHVGAQISPNVIRLSPNPKRVYPRYFFYALRSTAVQSFIDGSIASSAVPALKASDIKAARVPVLSKGAQKFVAHALGALDDKIELNRRMNATLEQMAQALFKSWFVDFDLVKAKAAGHAPEGMDAKTAALFPSDFQDSELGPIPKGWEVGQVSDFGEVICGKTPPTSDPENLALIFRLSQFLTCTAKSLFVRPLAIYP